MQLYATSANLKIMSIPGPTLTRVHSTVTLRQWQPAAWEDYVACRDDLSLERVRLFFNQGYFWIDMGSEGINHARVNELFTLLIFAWFSRFTDMKADLLGGCLLEKPKKQAASPDLVLYLGEEVPRWQSGEPRRIDLEQWRVPELVGEVSDTTLADDLDEKKKLYADLGIPEYWVVNVSGKQVLAFLLQENGKYQQCSHSIALNGLEIALLERALARLDEETNVSAALWFGQQLVNLKY
jgi:Uma2 family endonuclease